MQRFNFSRSAAALGVAAILLTACGAGGTQPSGATYSLVNGLPKPSVDSSAFQRLSVLPHGAPIVVHPDHNRSWISPSVKANTKLLFVSDQATSDVYIFNLTTLALVGTVTGFTFLNGLCSDASGNVWVANYVGYLQSYIVELSHTGSYLTEVYDPGLAAGCAVDPTTGDLAVANQYSYYYSNDCGNVVVYQLPSQYYPSRYTNPALGCTSYFFASYDQHGTLFVDGPATFYSGFALSKLPAGESSLETVTIKRGTIYFPGGVQWYSAGHYLVVADQECGAACLYRIKIKGTTGKITGVTSLYNQGGSGACDVAQMAITQTVSGTIVAGGDGELPCGYRSSTSVDVWSFPSGGLPTVTNASVVQRPVGAAISK